MVKRLTGNKTLKARWMHKNLFSSFQFSSRCGCWRIASRRSQGRTKGLRRGIWHDSLRGLFPARETHHRDLSEILINEEGPGILRWMVDGCFDRRRD